MRSILLRRHVIQQHSQRLVPLEPKRLERSVEQSNRDSTVKPVLFQQAMEQVANFCVLDTGCQRAAVGSRTLQMIQEQLPQGMQVRFESQSFVFKGVGGLTRTHEVAVIPICLGSRPAVIRAAVLHEPAEAPLLLSLPILKALDAQVCLGSASLECKAIQETVRLHYNHRGQLCVSLFRFDQIPQDRACTWKPKKLIGDECTIFLQAFCHEESPQYRAHTLSEMDKTHRKHHSVNAEGLHCQDVLGKYPVLRSFHGVARESIECEIDASRCEPEIPSENCGSKHSADFASTFDLDCADGREPQEKLSGISSSAGAQASQRLVKDVQSPPDSHTLPSNVPSCNGADDASYEHSDSFVHDRDSRSRRRDSGSRRHDGCDSDLGGREKGNSETGEAGASPSTTGATRGTSARTHEVRTDEPLLQVESQLPLGGRHQSIHAVQRQEQEGKEESVRQERADAQWSSIGGHESRGRSSGTAIEPLLLRTPRDHLCESHSWSKLPPAVQPLSKADWKAMPILSMDRASEIDSTPKALSRARDANWTGQERKDQIEGQLKQAEQIYQQLQFDVKQRLRADARVKGSCWVPIPPASMSARLEPQGNKWTSADAHLQDLWPQGSHQVLDRQSDGHTSGRHSEPESAEVGSAVQEETLRPGVRKRILGLIKARIDELESTESSRENNQDSVEEYVHLDPTDVQSVLHLHLIGEVFSSPRFTDRASRHGLQAGRAYDLKLGDNFLSSCERRDCLKHLQDNKYGFVAVSVPCHMFSMLQYLALGRNHQQCLADPVFAKKWKEAMTLLTFGTLVCHVQQQHGGCYLFEHPWSAKSWQQKCVAKLLNSPGAMLIRTDQCVFGQSDAQGSPIRKRTGFITNNSQIAKTLRRDCPANHSHVHCIGRSCGQSRATIAARYPNKMVDAVLSAYKRSISSLTKHDNLLFECHHRRIKEPMTVYSLGTPVDPDESSSLIFMGCRVSQGGCKKAADPVPESIFAAEPVDLDPSDIGEAIDLEAEEDDEQPGVDDIEEQPTSQEIKEEIANMPARRRQSLMHEIQKVHRGLGHPCLSNLLRILNHGKASPLIIALAKEFKCSMCIENKQPRPWRRAAPPRQLEFNQVVGVDTLTLRHFDRSIHCLNIVCWGTRYQMIIPLESKHAISIRKAYRLWIKMFGAPHVIHPDLGKEFQAEFASRCATDGSNMLPSSLEAPTQAAITEREGGSFKTIFAKTSLEYGKVEDQEELHELIDISCMMKNRLTHRGGYSAIQRVFGVTPCIPGEIMRGDHNNLHHMAEITAGDVILQKQEAMRLAAGRAFFAQECSSAIRRALHSGPRVSPEFSVGQTVYFWCSSTQQKVRHKNSASRRPNYMRWTGPASVIAMQLPTTLFLNFQGRLVKAAPEQCRMCSDDEDVACSSLLQKLCRVRDSLKSNKIGGMLDITGLDHPPSSPTSRVGVDPYEDHPTNKRRAFGKQPPSKKSKSKGFQGLKRKQDAIDLEESDVDSTGDSKRKCNEESQEIDFDDLYLHEVLEDPQVQQNLMQEETENHVFMIDREPNETRLTSVRNCWSMQSQTKELRLRDLDEHDRALFIKAIRKEWETNLNAGAIEVIPPMEASKIRQTQSHRIMQSRLLHVAKPIDDLENFDPDEILHYGRDNQPRKAKSRWIVRGDRDPDVFQVETTAPVIARDTMFIGLQLIASFGWTVFFADFSQAFMQGGELIRNEPLFCEIPVHEELPDVEPGSLVAVKKTVYGLTDAPSAWNRHLDKALQGLGYRPSILDPCLYTLHVQEQFHGLIMVATDDLIHAGGREHGTRMESLRQRFRFGKWEHTQGRFCGKDMFQKSDKTIEVSQAYYVDAKCRDKIPIPKGLGDEEPCSPEQIKELRSKVGALSWIAKETRVDLAGAVALLMQAFPNPCVRDLKNCNKILKEAVMYKDLKIRISPIEPEDLCIVVTSDAAWGNALDENKQSEKSQAGYLVMTASRAMLQGKQASFSILGWKSHTLKRRTVSTLGAETQAIVESASVSCWYRYIFLECMNPKFKATLSANWETGIDSMEFGLVTDAKSVFDALSRPSAISATDKRTCIDLSIIREFLRRNNGCVRWIDGRYQLADSLTKVMPSDFLRSVMKLGHYQLHEEYNTLALRREARKDREQRKARLQQERKES